MDKKDFTYNIAGECIETLDGYCTFLPKPLPARIDYDKELILLHSDCSKLVGELSGTGRLLKNPYFLVSPYIRREAVSSSKIEGTESTLSDILIFEASELRDYGVSDVREVSNYVKAMEYGLKRIHELPISIRLIKEIHKILMDGVRGQQSAPGQLRAVQNWIGPKGCSINDATYVPPPVPILSSRRF